MVSLLCSLFEFSIKEFKRNLLLDEKYFDNSDPLLADLICSLLTQTKLSLISAGNKAYCDDCLSSKITMLVSSLFNLAILS